MAITKEQIFQAADQLIASGGSPTLANVRKALGGGSFTTISEAMGEWRAAKQQAASIPPREPAPAAIAARLEELGADIWAGALEMANSRLSSERETLETTKTQLESAQQEAAELAEQLSTELESLQTQHQQTIAALEVANANNGQLRHDNAMLAHQLATSEAKAAETTKRIDDLKAEVRRAHVQTQAQQQLHATETQDLRERHAQTDEILKTKTAEATRLQLELSHAQTQASSAQQQHQAQQQRSSEALRQTSERLTQAQTELGHAQQIASNSREEAARQRGELEALRMQTAALLEALKPAPSAPPENAGAKNA